MCRKLNIICAVMYIILNIAACGKEPVNYIPDYADDSSGVCSSDYTSEDAVCDDSDMNDSDMDDVGKNDDQDGSGEDMDVVNDSKDAATATDEKIPVHVCGAVNNPGLYYMSADSLKADALSVAGGFAVDAAIDYVNLAEMITYGEKIYFPYSYELEEGYNLNAQGQGQGDGPANKLVNINTATKDELMTLPGIGESKADAIIKYRENNGPFQSTEDITNIPGIKEGVYNNIKEHIVVN